MKIVAELQSVSIQKPAPFTCTLHLVGTWTLAQQDLWIKLYIFFCIIVSLGLLNFKVVSPIFSLLLPHFCLFLPTTTAGAPFIKQTFDQLGSKAKKHLRVIPAKDLIHPFTSFTEALTLWLIALLFSPLNNIHCPALKSYTVTLTVTSKIKVWISIQALALLD